MFGKGRFVTSDEGDPAIVISDAGQGVALAYGASDGRMQVRHSLDALRRNRWIELSKRGAR